MIKKEQIKINDRLIFKSKVVPDEQQSVFQVCIEKNNLSLDYFNDKNVQLKDGDKLVVLNNFNHSKTILNKFLLLKVFNETQNVEGYILWDQIRKNLYFEDHNVELERKNISITRYFVANDKGFLSKVYVKNIILQNQKYLDKDGNVFEVEGISRKLKLYLDKSFSNRKSFDHINDVKLYISRLYGFYNIDKLCDIGMTMGIDREDIIKRTLYLNKIPTWLKTDALLSKTGLNKLFNLNVYNYNVNEKLVTKNKLNIQEHIKKQLLETSLILKYGQSVFEILEKYEKVKNKLSEAEKQKLVVVRSEIKTIIDKDSSIKSKQREYANIGNSIDLFFDFAIKKNKVNSLIISKTKGNSAVLLNNEEDVNKLMNNYSGKNNLSQIPMQEIIEFKNYLNSSIDNLLNTKTNKKEKVNIKIKV